MIPTHISFLKYIFISLKKVKIHFFKKPKKQKEKQNREDIKKKKVH